MTGGPSSAPAARERRWAVIAPDGRHVWLGRHSDPSPEELAQAESGLRAQGLGGWLAVVAGNYWSRRTKLDVLEVRALAEPNGSFETAVAEFRAARERKLAELA
jgi:hypothetical protein